MNDYQISPSTRRCALSGRELKPGERYFSVLLDESGKFVRKDYAADSWSGPPTSQAVGFWQAKVPNGSAPRRPAVDEEMLVECLSHMEGTTELSAQKFRYVLALFLLRRRRLRLEETRKQGEVEVLSLRCMRSGERFSVIDPSLSDAEFESVQDDVFRVLGWQ